jgi:type I restriction enzyme S subunit
MSKNNENNTSTKLSGGLVPKLRFPEFQKEDGWEKKLLDEISNVTASGDLDEKTFSSIKTDTHIYPVYSNSVFEEGIYGYSSTFKYKSGSVTITARGTLGVAFERKTDFVGIGRLLILSDLKNVHSTFLKENWNHQAKIPLENGGIPQLTAVKAKSVVLFFPKLKEQQKIAACLSSLDEVITTENQKLEVLKDHKKGLLQNLFPQEGETVPKFRFKEFDDSGEWEEKKLGSCCNSLSSGKDKNVEDGEYELYGSTGIIGRAENASYEGDFILVARVGANAGLLNKVKGKFGVTDNTLVIDLVKKDIINFIFYSLENVGLKELVFGSGQPLITGGQLKSFLLSIPTSEQEQQKIASFLSSIDELINAQNQKIETLKLHKKGLLQGLFPGVNEI